MDLRHLTKRVHLADEHKYEMSRDLRIALGLLPLQEVPTPVKFTARLLSVLRVAFGFSDDQLTGLLSLSLEGEDREDNLVYLDRVANCLNMKKRAHQKVEEWAKNLYFPVREANSSLTAQRALFVYLFTGLLHALIDGIEIRYQDIRDSVLAEPECQTPLLSDKEKLDYIPRPRDLARFAHLVNSGDDHPLATFITLPVSQMKGWSE